MMAVRVLVLGAAIALSACMTTVDSFAPVNADQVGHTTYRFSGWVYLTQINGAWAAVIDPSHGRDQAIFFGSTDTNELRERHGAQLGDRIYVQSQIISTSICIVECHPAPSEGYYFKQPNIWGEPIRR
jgi:hypothetical protein